MRFYISRATRFLFYSLVSTHSFYLRDYHIVASPVLRCSCIMINNFFFVNKFLLRAKTHTYVYLPGQNTGTGNSSKSPVKPTITMSSVWLVSLLTKKITNILSGIEMLAHNVVQKKKLNK